MITDAILQINPNAKVTVIGNDKDINSNQIIWHEGTTPIPIADIEAKMAELPTPEEEATARENLKASAKAKLIAGEPLTEEEANTIVL
jgi:polysaccharide pyruvyl transferase WcaK-like protein